MTLIIGGKEVQKTADAAGRLVMIIWGQAGVGKTTLAMTAPGRKLHLCFDPGGFLSVTGRDDMEFVDLTTYPIEQVKQFASSSPLTNLDKALDEFDTVVVDSLTTLEEKTLKYAIKVTPGATLERPSPGAYGGRGAYVVEFVRNMIELCEKKDKHLVFLAHESPPDKDKEGNIVSYPLQLGGKIPNNVALRINEVWHLSAGAKPTDNHRIAVRPVRQRRPMKSRMFLASSPAEFEWVYDADKLCGDGLANWYNVWKENGFKKISTPDGKFNLQKECK